MIAADIAEAALAGDGTTTGNVVFATLLDDPASVRDSVDAFLGSIMKEAALAADAISIGLIYAAATAEAATAQDSPSATIISGVTLATFDGAATVTTVSNGNLTATHNATTTPAGVRSTQLKSSGKYYFEVTLGASHGSTDFMGIILSTAAVGDPATGTNVSAVYPGQGGGIYSNNGFTSASIPTPLPGDAVGIAIDLDNRKAWFRRNNGGWLNQAIGSQNPATNTGGVVIASGSWTPAVGFLGAGSASGDNFTGNFGQSTFVAAAPAGFGNWSA